MMNTIPAPLSAYIEAEILPRYALFDAAHRIDHARMVIDQSMQLVDMVNDGDEYENENEDEDENGDENEYEYENNARPCTEKVSRAMAYVIAAYHDTGLCEGREHHHTVSARIIRSDSKLLQWFTPEQIDIMADAAEDHRASAKTAPRTIYGRIVAEADRFIDPVTIIRRTVQFGFDHYPELGVEEHYQRCLDHLREKYGDGGYLQLWIPGSPNAQRLKQLRAIIRKPEQLRPIFDSLLKVL